MASTLSLVRRNHLQCTDNVDCITAVHLFSKAGYYIKVGKSESRKVGFFSDFRLSKIVSGTIPVGNETWYATKCGGSSVQIQYLSCRLSLVGLSRSQKVSNSLRRPWDMLLSTHF